MNWFSQACIRFCFALIVAYTLVLISETLGTFTELALQREDSPEISRNFNELAQTLQLGFANLALMGLGFALFSGYHRIQIIPLLMIVIAGFSGRLLVIGVQTNWVEAANFEEHAIIVVALSYLALALCVIIPGPMRHEVDDPQLILLDPEEESSRS